MAQSQLDHGVAFSRRQATASSTNSDDRSGSCGQAWSTSIDLPLDADVVCQDSVVGHTSVLMLHTSMHVVTHVIVREAAFPHSEWLVPLHLIASTGPDYVRLRVGSSHFWMMDPFREISYLPIEGDLERGLPGRKGRQVEGPDLLAPSSPRARRVERLAVPPGTAMLHRGTSVLASDGVAGHLTNVLVEPQTGRLTYLLLYVNHQTRREIVVSASHITRVKDGRIDVSPTRAQVSGPGAVRVRHFPG